MASKRWDLKNRAQIVRPLLVDVVMAALKRNRRRKKHHRSEGRKIGDETLGARRGKMFGNLERKRQVEFPLDLEGLLEVGATEALARNLQLVLIDPDTVQPEDVFDPVFAKNRQPRATAAADIDDALGG